MTHPAAVGFLAIALSALSGAVQAQAALHRQDRQPARGTGPRVPAWWRCCRPVGRSRCRDASAITRWCDVVAGPNRGWVYAGNINYYYQNSYVPLLNYGTVIGIGVLAFIIDDYWGRHYRDRPWYPERHRWADPAPPLGRPRRPPPTRIRPQPPRRARSRRATVRVRQCRLGQRPLTGAGRRPRQPQPIGPRQPGAAIGPSSSRAPRQPAVRAPGRPPAAAAARRGAGAGRLRDPPASGWSPQRPAARRAPTETARRPAPLPMTPAVRGPRTVKSRALPPAPQALLPPMNAPVDVSFFARAAKPLTSYRKYWAARFGTAPFLPMSRAEMDQLGWDSCDIIIVTGDAYVDHPSFGMAVIGRMLEAQGFRVGIIAQPDWHSAEPFKALGKPNLFFGVTAGNMDSMINRYTADRKIRSDDAYTPGDVGGKRPDRAAIVYSQRCREAFKDVPIVLGGIEGSLRRIAHYDYWSDKVRRSILVDAKCDLLLYGNAERAIVEIAHRLAAKEPVAADHRRARHRLRPAHRRPRAGSRSIRPSVDQPGPRRRPHQPVPDDVGAGGRRRATTLRQGRRVDTACRARARSSPAIQTADLRAQPRAQGKASSRCRRATAP